MHFCILLRVPLIFIMDELFKSSFGLPDLVDIIIPVSSTNNQIEIAESAQYNKAFIKIIVSCLMLCSSLCLLILPTRYLFLVYLHVASVCVVFVSYWENIQILEFLSGKYKNFTTDIINEVITLDLDEYYVLIIIQLYQLLRSIMVQYFLSLVFDFLQVYTTDHSIHKVFRYSFIIPTLIASIPKTSRILNTVIMLSTLLQLLILLKTLLLNVFNITNLIRDGYNYIQQIINNYGISALVEMEWYRLKFPSVLRLFWAIRVLKQILYLLINIEIKNLTLFEVFKYLLIKGCDSSIAVLGMTSFVSYFGGIIKAFFQWVLLFSDVDDLSCRVISAILFIIVSMQSGLTGLNPETRFIKLFESVFLVCSGLQDYIHHMVDDLFKHLSASHNLSLNRHSRALLVCGFLIVLAVTILKYLWSYYSLSPWLLAVTSMNILHIIKVLVSLAVYLLFLINSYRSTFWEKFDDYVYYIKSIGNIFEFGFCCFLFLNGVYNMAFVSGGIVRASTICIQAYLNMSLAMKRWREFIKRSIAVKKIESLPEATSVQLSEYDDVCAICYQNMRSAKRTECNHYFHSICLRKWLYIQDKCPLCFCIFNKAEM